MARLPQVLEEKLHSLVGHRLRLFAGVPRGNAAETTVVTPDDHVGTCSEKEEPDLFWPVAAGGGANFGDQRGRVGTPDAPSALTSTGARLRGFDAPYTSRYAYTNFIDRTQGDWARAYYGENLDQLIRVKRRYDRDDFFSFGQGVPV